MSFPEYENYRDSGIDWLGDVPDHWEVLAIKHIVSTPVTDGPHETPEFIDEGIPFVSAEAVSSGVIDFSKIRGFISEEDHLQYSRKYKPQVGDIYMVKSGASTGTTAIVDTDREFNIWSPLAVVRCDSESVPKFALNFLRSRNFQEGVTLNWSFGTQQNIGMNVIENLSITRPPIEEQTAIAEFLDRETSKIDDLIAEQTRLIELLKEKRQAVISHAVTKGLNPDAPLKSSGIEWMGEVPEHWAVASLRYFATFCTGSTPDRNNPAFWNGDIPWVKTGEINYTLIEETDETITQEGLNSSSCSIVSEGTLLMALYGQGVTRGRVALLGISAAFNQACVAITVDNRISNHFIHAFFVFAYSHIRDIGNETTQMNMNVEFVRRVRIVVPPINEQIQIAKHVSREGNRFENLISEAEHAIELLQERRTALISAAVTGKIDVREFAYQETA